jgi:hypothetical protein
VLKPVVRSRKHRAAFVPDNLLVMQEADAQQGELSAKLREGSIFPPDR